MRVTEDNNDVISAHVEAIAPYVELSCGYPMDLTDSRECHGTVKALCRFLLQLWFNPDGTDAQQLEQVIASLRKAVKALVIAEHLDRGE